MTQAVPDVAAHLRHLPLFADLAPELVALVASEVEVRRVTAGTVIFQLGDPGDAFFVVLDGTVQIYHPASGGQHEVIAELGAGRWFGEMALITGEPRSAAACAETPVTLLVMSRASFQGLLGRVPALGLTLSSELSRRLRTHLLRQPTAQVPNLIVLEDWAPSVDSANAAARLAHAVAEEIGDTVGLLDLAEPPIGAGDGTGVELLAPPALSAQARCSKETA